MKKTKMVCTIGPKSENKETMKTLLDAGMNVMRLNFSHGDFVEHGGRIDNLEAIMKETGKVFAILLDTRGPEIRTCKLEDGQDIQLVTGQKITITTDESVIGNREIIAVNYPDFAKDVRAGDRVLLDDGLIELVVTSTTDTTVECEVQNNGSLGEKKGVNLPNTHISMPFLSEHDQRDIKWGITKGIDFVAASFTRNKRDVLDIREFLDANGGKDVHIIAKIENQEGLDNFEDILDTADAIMVARGDLGVEIPAQEVIFAQKRIIQRCNEVNKPVITATQMLDSMIKNPRPTRAEAGDVANAILDGTDAVMLSGESAKGKYPLQAVKTMATICDRTDKEIEPRYMSHEDMKNAGITRAVCQSVVEASEVLDIKLIICATENGGTPRNLRRHFPHAQILALSSNVKTARQLCVVRGVIPVIADNIESTDGFFEQGMKIALELGLAQKGEDVIMANNALVPSGTTNTLSVHTL